MEAGKPPKEVAVRVLFGGVTEFLAVYGAILSSIGFGWNLYRDLLDRARLQVTAHVRRIVHGPDGRMFAAKPDLQIAGASKELFVCMSVVNVGRRPLAWEGWGGRYCTRVNGKSGFTIIGQHLPRMLKEGETHSEFTLLEHDLRPVSDNVKSLFMWDASGRHWRLSRRELNELKREAREFQSGIS